GGLQPRPFQSVAAPNQRFPGFRCAQSGLPGGKQRLNQIARFVTRVTVAGAGFGGRVCFGGGVRGAPPPRGPAQRVEGKRAGGWGMERGGGGGVGGGG